MIDLDPALRRALLAPRPVAPGVGADGVPWTSVAADVDAHALGALVLARLQDLGLDGQLPASVRLRWTAEQVHARVQHAAQLRVAARVTSELTRHAVPHAWMKGLAYRLAYYRPAWTRVAGDCDLLVRPGDVATVRAALRRLGLVQATCTPDCREYLPATSAEIARAEAGNHELAQFVRSVRLAGADHLLRPPFVARPPFAYERDRSGLVLHVHVDVHRALHPYLREADPLRGTRWERAPGGGSLPVLGRAWSLVFTGFKVYFEAARRDGTRLGHLVDLAALSQDAQDWAAVSDVLRRWHLATPVLGAVEAAERLVGRPLLPRAVAQDWRSSPRDPRLLDRGDVGDLLLGARRTPVPVP